MHRTGFAQWWAEILGTCGRICVIFGGLRSRTGAVPALAALCITGARRFTAPPGFATPATILARKFSDTFAGIYPGRNAGFVVAQTIAMLVAHTVPGRPLATDHGR